MAMDVEQISGCWEFIAAKIVQKQSAAFIEIFIRKYN
jgi:hypothetical protein